MLSLSAVRVQIGARVLLEETSLLIRQGEKVALVGANGVGKTTLLRTIAGDHELASGKVITPKSTAYLRQETPRILGNDHQSALDYLLAASPLTAMRETLDHHTMQMGIHQGEELEATIHAYSELHEIFLHANGYDLQGKAEQIASGVGLTPKSLLSPVATLSGGQRRRLDLAGLLLAGGDLFILDEPTNHLDAPAKKWVMNFLSTTKATVLVVSHDISLMDSSFTRVLVLENSQMESYPGTYSDYLRLRQESEQQRAHQARNIAKETSRLVETKKLFSKGNATHATKRRALQRRIDALNLRMKDHAPAIKARPLHVTFPAPERAGDQVLTVTNLSKTYTSPVFTSIDFQIQRGEMLLLVGINGAGKTTLLRCLAGREVPTTGNVRLGANVKVGYYAQEHEDILPHDTVLENIRQSSPTSSEGTLRAVLAHFGLTNEVATQSAGTLSGGEKTKLALARLMVTKANLLLLDEPTNNLDPSSVEALLSALQNYEGTLILVSHDASFVSQLAPGRVLLLPKCTLTYFDEQVLLQLPNR